MKTAQDGRLSDVGIARRLQVHTSMVYLVRKCFAEQGLQRTLERKKRWTPPNPPKVTGELEARIIVLSCCEPPKEKNRGGFTDALALRLAKRLEIHYTQSMEVG